MYLHWISADHCACSTIICTTKWHLYWHFGVLCAQLQHSTELNNGNVCVCVAWYTYSLAQSHSLDWNLLAKLFVSKQDCWTASLIRSSSSRAIIIALLSPPRRSLDWGRSLSFSNMHFLHSYTFTGTRMAQCWMHLMMTFPGREREKKVPSTCLVTTRALF